MAVTAPSNKFRIAFGKQSAESTALATPVYELPYYAGNIAPTQVEEDHEVSDSSGLIPGVHIMSAGWGGQITVPSFADVAASYWAHHLGLDTIVGAADPYTHTITDAVTKGFETVYIRRPAIVGGTDLWERGVDGVISAIETTFAKGDVVKDQITYIGKTWDSAQATPTPATTKKLDTAGPWHSMIGAVLQLDVDSGTAVTVRNIESGMLRSEYIGAEWVQTDELTGRFLSIGGYRVSGSLTGVVENYDAYKNTYFGAVAGTALSPIPTLGVVNLTFPVGPTADTNRTRQHIVKECRIRVEDVPALDVGGGALRVTVTFKGLKPATGEIHQAIFKNAVATAL